MKSKTFLSLMTFILIASLVFGGTVPARAQILDKPAAAPGSPTDETKVPHYFGPYPNWANSPFTQGDAQVVITGDGTGATAVATVGANGAITDITVTSPGQGYTNAKVDIVGSGTGALADATIVKKGAVVDVTVDQPGTGYTAPVITFSGNGGASGTVYGGVEPVVLISGGFGYQFPTVDFDMPDGPNGVQAQGHAIMDANGIVTAIVLDNPGSGYSTAPNVVIRDGTLFDPINHDPGTFTEAAATTSLFLQEIVLDAFGSGYQSAPLVTITDPTGSGASATAFIDNGVISAITIKKSGSGYVTPGGIKKFTDQLPGLCQPPACPTAGKYIPLGVPEAKTYNGVAADEYVIGLVQYRTNFSSSLPDTLVRGYVQIETAANANISQHFALYNEMLDGTKVPVTIDGTPAYALTPPQYLGPTLVATKDRPVRIVFYNLLPTGSGGDLFLPTDSTLMGSGMGPMEMPAPVDNQSVMDEIRNPMCSESPKDTTNCFADNRATLHLHGGNTPWISDGTPHQWITPAGENTTWPEGVTVQNVPDMDVCNGNADGCQTFYYTNQQSARLLFYHDHSWGITRLNVYAGEAAGYLITDSTEQALINSGTVPGTADTIPLIIQDKTFVPDAAQLALQDPTWDAARWGSKGSFWYHHVYMPAQNPGDPSGMSAYGRWMYGPWFWPPAANTTYGPIPNPYYKPSCNLDDPSTWQYQTDPFCEPEQIPGTPNISVGMEQFNDTPIVNGVAYPTITLEPKTYRFRVLSAANDRFFNFQWYVGDPSTASTSTNTLGQVIGETEVALNPTELAAAQLDPNVFPTPVQSTTTAGPDWIQIGTEGGFLPAPVVVDGQQPTTWITDPTRFDVGNVDKHSLLLAPAERADVIVDFSKFAGRTLILYNDAPAAFPARVASYDYYTGAPDLSPVGAPTILPGYGPNTRTIMQVKIASSAAAPAYNLTKLQSAFRHNASGTGVFESGQHPIIVGQAAYNTTYGTSFASAGNCNAPGSTVQRCDGFVRVSDTAQFGFNTLKAQSTKMTLPLQPKAIHDEMNSTTFDEFGRMQATLGVEAQPPNPGAQNVTLYPYTSSPTEIIDGTNLPKASDIKITPITSATDGTQIWRITHNGVDTHPIHFHLYDVQIVNRVTWDNIIIAPDANELGWKDTVRISPLEDTIVALRPVIPQVPFDIPNSIHEISPMMPDGVELSPGLLADPQGNPVQIFNHLVNFGWEYVYHCHILSHEEMDMMRPVILALPPKEPTAVNFNTTTSTLSWTDNSLSETAFAVEKSTDGATWTEVYRVNRALTDQATKGQLFNYTDLNYTAGSQYRVVAENTVGDVVVSGFPTTTVKSYGYISQPPAAPTNLSASLQAGPQVLLTWTDNSANETSFVLERSTNGGNFTTLQTLPLNTTSFVDTSVIPGGTYTYQVKAVNALGSSAYSNLVGVSIPTIPAAPSNLMATLSSGPQVGLTWTDNSDNESGFIIERSVNGGAFSVLTTTAANALGYFDSAVTIGNTYAYQVKATNLAGTSAVAGPVSVSIPTVPAAPTSLNANLQAGPQVVLTFTDNSTNETGFRIERSVNGGGYSLLTTLSANTVTFTDTTILPGTSYRYRVASVNQSGMSAFATSNNVNVPAVPVAPSNFTATNGTNQGTSRRVVLTWTDNSNNETGFRIERSTDGVNWTLVTTTGANTTTYTVSSLTRNTSYYFRIRANNGTIIASAWVSATPYPITTNP